MKTDPLVSFLDRFAAVAVQVDRLLLRLQKRNGVDWHHYTNSNGGIYSVRTETGRTK